MFFCAEYACKSATEEVKSCVTNASILAHSTGKIQFSHLDLFNQQQDQSIRQSALYCLISVEGCANEANEIRMAEIVVFTPVKKRSMLQGFIIKERALSLNCVVSEYYRQ